MRFDLLLDRRAIGELEGPAGASLAGGVGSPAWSTAFFFGDGVYWCWRFLDCLTGDMEVSDMGVAAGEGQRQHW